MRRVVTFLVLVGLGGLAALVFILGAEPFEVPGQNPIGERLGGAVAVAAFFAMCQFWLARTNAAASMSSWSAVTSMLVGLVAVGLFVVAAEGPAQWRLLVAPALLAAVIGATVGVTLGRRARAARAHPPARGA